MTDKPEKLKDKEDKLRGLDNELEDLKNEKYEGLTKDERRKKEISEDPYVKYLDSVRKDTIDKLRPLELEA